MSAVVNQNKKFLKMIAVGLMAALVFAGNYLQIKIPVSIGSVTRIHLGNSMCLLAGLLFGPGAGGLASGIGAGLYDLFDPIYILSAPYTFCSKFAMGFIAGLLNRRFAEKEGHYRPAGVILSGVAGQVVYIFLYLLKSYAALRLVGTAPNAALIAVAPKIATSFVNAAAAVVISVPLFFALDKALRRTGFYTLIHAQKAEKGSYWNPVTGMLAAYCCLITLVFAIYLGSVNNIRKAEAEKEAAVASQLADYEAKLQYLADELNVTLPETEPEGRPKQNLPSGFAQSRI